MGRRRAQAHGQANQAAAARLCGSAADNRYALRQGKSQYAVVTCPLPAYQSKGRESTFIKCLLGAAGLSKEASTGQEHTLYSPRHTYATEELLAGTEIHTRSKQMGTSVRMLERHYSKLTATLAACRLVKNHVF